MRSASASGLPAKSDVSVRPDDAQRSARRKASCKGLGMTPGGETEHLALVAQRAEAEQSGDALVEPPRRGAGCVRRRQPRQGLVAEHPGGVVDTEVAYAVDGDDRRLVEAGAVGARHRVTGVVIEEPQPGAYCSGFDEAAVVTVDGV